MKNPPEMSEEAVDQDEDFFISKGLMSLLKLSLQTTRDSCSVLLTSGLRMQKKFLPTGTRPLPPP